MCMQYVDLLAQENVANVGKRGEEARERRVNVSWREGMDGNVVDFNAVGKVANTASRWIGVGDDDDLQATRQEVSEVASSR